VITRGYTTRSERPEIFLREQQEASESEDRNKDNVSFATGRQLRAEGDQHADVGGVALGEAAVAAVGRQPRASGRAVRLSTSLARLAALTTDPGESHSDVETGNTGNVALVVSDVAERALEERAVSTIGLSALAVLAVNASSNPSLRDVGRPGRARSHLLSALESTGASLPLGGNAATALVVELELMVRSHLHD
jgi:hypothetical protein